jgi:hypothetical protein
MVITPKPARHSAMNVLYTQTRHFEHRRDDVVVHPAIAHSRREVGSSVALLCATNSLASIPGDAGR